MLVFDADLKFDASTEIQIRETVDRPLYDLSYVYRDLFYAANSLNATRVEAYEVLAGGPGQDDMTLAVEVPGRRDYQLFLERDHNRWLLEDVR